jgi:hypothetical protein
MEAVTLIIAVVALVLAVVAIMRTGGIGDLRHQLERVAEVDLLVDRGDTVTLAVPRYAPFVEDPVIARVRKPESAPGAESPTAPSPAAGGGSTEGGAR